MNHRIEMEYNKLLQMAASGSLQQVQLQRKRLQTLDRNEDLSRDHWFKIDLLLALRQRDSQKVMQSDNANANANDNADAHAYSANADHEEDNRANVDHEK